jgi:hypothetical protein
MDALHCLVFNIPIICIFLFLSISWTFYHITFPTPGLSPCMPTSFIPSLLSAPYLFPIFPLFLAYSHSPLCSSPSPFHPSCSSPIPSHLLRLTYFLFSLCNFISSLCFTPIPYCIFPLLFRYSLCSSPIPTHPSALTNSL